MPSTAPLPNTVEEHRDRAWRRDERLRVRSVVQAERFIDDVGIAGCMTDSRRPGPSLYVAVCGRRDAVLPRNVQKDPESSGTWRLKDELMRRGNVYYAKMGRGRAMFLAARMIPYFKAIWAIPGSHEKHRLSEPARRVLGVLRKEWEMGSADLRSESGVTDRKLFNVAMDELQAAMLVVPGEAVYEPRFTYIWELATERFPEQLASRIGQEKALTEIARCFLTGAGLTVPGELARVTGLSRPEAGFGNQSLVKEGFARRVSRGTYHLANLDIETGTRSR
jgi:hypothetical protein